jgi:hypothetical protein
VATAAAGPAAASMLLVLLLQELLECVGVQAGWAVCGVHACQQQGQGVVSWQGLHAGDLHRTALGQLSGTCWGCWGCADCHATSVGLVGVGRLLAGAHCGWCCSSCRRGRQGATLDQGEQGGCGVGQVLAAGCSCGSNSTSSCCCRHHLAGTEGIGLSSCRLVVRASSSALGWHGWELLLGIALLHLS